MLTVMSRHHTSKKCIVGKTAQTAHSALFCNFFNDLALHSTAEHFIIPESALEQTVVCQNNLVGPIMSLNVAKLNTS